MDPKLRHAVQRNQHAQVEETALLAVQAWPVPDVAPGVLGDEVLEGPGEGAGVVGEGVVHVGIAEDGAAGLHALGVGVGVSVGVSVGVGSLVGHFIGIGV